MTLINLNVLAVLLWSKLAVGSCCFYHSCSIAIIKKARQVTLICWFFQNTHTQIRIMNTQVVSQSLIHNMVIISPASTHLFFVGAFSYLYFFVRAFWIICIVPLRVHFAPLTTKRRHFTSVPAIIMPDRINNTSLISSNIQPHLDSFSWL